MQVGNISATFVRPANTTAYSIGLLAALGAYTPASAEQFSVILEPLEAY